MSWLQVDMHNGLGTFAYDVGLYDQGLWLLSRGEAPFVTLMGRNLFGDHASLILLFLVPLYWVLPGTGTLLVVQAFVIAAGAIPLYLLARQKLQNNFWALIIAVVWLANPAVNGTGMENFHPDSFLGLFIPMALYAAFSRQWRLYALSVGLALLVKEDVLLLMIPLGVYVAVFLDRKKGLWTVFASVIATMAGMFILMRAITGITTRNAWRVPFGGIDGLLAEVFLRPLNVVQYLLQDDRPLYIFQMTAPLAGLFLLAPWFALVALPVISWNLLSTFWYQHSIQYHYSIVVMPVLVVGVILGVAKLRQSWKRPLMLLVLLTSLVTSVAWGQHSLSANPRDVLPGNSPIAIAGREILKRVPPDAAISLYDPLTTHAAHRKDVYFFPNPFSTLYYGINDSESGVRLPVSDRIEYVVLPRYMSEGLRGVWDWVKMDYVELDSNLHWQVFKKRSP
jgi:uncharacterized membrane protein